MQYLFKNRVIHSQAQVEEKMACFESPNQDKRAAIAVIVLWAFYVALIKLFEGNANILLACLFILLGIWNSIRALFSRQIWAHREMRLRKKRGLLHTDMYFYEDHVQVCVTGSESRTVLYYRNMEKLAQSEKYLYLVMPLGEAYELAKDGFEGLTPQEAERFLWERISVR